MKYVIGGLVGLIWGAAAAVLNAYISKRALAKNSAKSLLLANVIRCFVDIAALAVMFLLRKVLPFSFEAAIIGTALAMSMLTIVFAYKLSRP